MYLPYQSFKQVVLKWTDPWNWMKNTLLFTDCTNILVRLLTVTCPKNPKMCDPIIVNPVVKMRLHPLASYKEGPPPPPTHTHTHTHTPGFRYRVGWHIISRQENRGLPTISRQKRGVQLNVTTFGAILTPKRNWRQCLCNILEWPTKSIMVCQGIFWSAKLA